MGKMRCWQDGLGSFQVSLLLKLFISMLLWVPGGQAKWNERAEISWSLKSRIGCSVVWALSPVVLIHAPSSSFQLPGGMSAFLRWSMPLCGWLYATSIKNHAFLKQAVSWPGHICLVPNLPLLGKVVEKLLVSTTDHSRINVLYEYFSVRIHGR